VTLTKINADAHAATTNGPMYRRREREAVGPARLNSVRLVHAMILRSRHLSSRSRPWFSGHYGSHATQAIQGDVSMDRRRFVLGLLGGLLCVPLASSGAMAQDPSETPGPPLQGSGTDPVLKDGAKDDPAAGRLRRGESRADRRVRRGERRAARVKRRAARRSLRTRLRSSYR
jgi:hypothetical protein